MTENYQVLLEQLRSLHGKSITGVSYFDACNDAHVPNWNYYGREFDFIDFGIDLVIDRKENYSITWDEKFCQYGLNLYSTSLSNHLINYSVWDVTKYSQCSTVVGIPIDTVNIYASWSWLDIGATRTLCPHTFEFKFTPGIRFFVIAAKYLEHQDILFPMTDSVVVIAKDAVAEKYGIGPFNSTNLLLA